MSQKITRTFPLRDLSNDFVNRSFAGPGAVGGASLKKRPEVVTARVHPSRAAGSGGGAGVGSELMITAGASTEHVEPEPQTVVSRGCAYASRSLTDSLMVDRRS